MDSELQELLLLFLANYLILGMYPESSPLIITRMLRVFPEGEIKCHYELGKMVQHGAQASVHELRQLSHPLRPENNGKEFLVRITHKKNAKDQLQQSRTIMQHYALLKSLNELYPQENFLREQAVWQDQKHYYQLFQHCCYGSLDQLLEYHIKQNRPFKAMHILYFVRQILKMLDVLHQKKMVHGSVRGQNLWLNAGINVKLGGFESARKEGQSKRGLRCSVYQIPPETIQYHQESAKSDIWMLGILTYRMHQFRFPFMTDLQHNRLPISEKYGVIFSRIKSNQVISFDPNLGQSLQADLRELIKQMLNKTSRLRSSAAELLAHKIFAKIEQDSEQIRRQIIKDHLMYLMVKKSKITQWRFQPITDINGQVERGLREVKKIRIVQAFRIEQYGFFFRLSNNSMVAYFNNHNILKATKQQQLNKTSRQYFENERFKIMRYVHQKYFKYNLNNQLLDEQPRQKQQTQNCSISKLFWQQNTLFVRLTNETIQIFTITQQQHNHSVNSPQYFDYYFTFNNSPSKPNQIILYKNNRFFVFHSYEQVKQNPESQKYFNHIDKCISLILDNSTISKEKCRLGFSSQK